MKKIFLVYLENERAPLFVHVTYESAITEAKRLAKAHNKKAYVLMSIATVKLNEFEIEYLGDELPF